MARSWLSHSAKPSSIPVELRYAKRLQITMSRLPNFICNSFVSHWPRECGRWRMAFRARNKSQSQRVKSPAVFRR